MVVSFLRSELNSLRRAGYIKNTSHRYRREGVRFLQHLQQLNLLTGRAGKEPVLQAAEGIRQDLLLRCGEADNACRLEVSRGLVEVVNVNSKVRDAALAGRHERACGRLDQLEQEAAEFNECQLLQAFRRLYALRLNTLPPIIS